jgi:putative DNA primase/helicase
MSDICTLEDILRRVRQGEAKGKILADLQRIGGTLGTGDLPMLAELGAERGYGGMVTEIRRDIQRRPVAREDREELREERRKGAPEGLPQQWRDPPGWLCAWSGLFKLKEDRDGEITEVRVTHDPLWIGRRVRDVDTGVHHLDLCWPGGTETVDRGVALQSSELVSLASRGAPVSSRSAADVVAYLEAAEAVNRGALPVSTSITRLGWTMLDGERVWQGPEGPHLLRVEGGHAQTVAAMQPRGAWERWRAVAQEAIGQPVPALMLCAAAGSAALEAIPEAVAFTVDLHGLTSTGKSTTLRFCASLWGDPSDTGGLLLPWSSTMTAIERRAAFLRHSPMFVDDTKKCPERERASKLVPVVYSWGVGKARGTVGGVQEVATWRSIMLSTGEAPLAEIAGEHGGLRMRVIPVSATPFPVGHPAVRMIEGLDSWGHGGPRVAEWVRTHWDALPARWAKARDKAEAATGNSRLAGYIASVGIGAMALQGIGLRVPMAAVEELLIEGARAALVSSDIPTAAWERIQGWLAGAEGRIAEQEGWTRNSECPQGWIGKVLRDGRLAIQPSALEGELRRLGYDPSEIVARWSVAGRCSAKLEPVKWMGKTVKMYLLNVESGWKQGAAGDDAAPTGEAVSTGESVTGYGWPHGEVPV